MDSRKLILFATVVVLLMSNTLKAALLYYDGQDESSTYVNTSNNVNGLHYTYPGGLRTMPVTGGKRVNGGAGEAGNNTWPPVARRTVASNIVTRLRAAAMTTMENLSDRAPALFPSLSKSIVHGTWSAATPLHLGYVVVVALACTAGAIARMRARVYR